MEKERQWNKEYNDFDVNFTSKTLVGLLNELSVANAKYNMTQRKINTRLKKQTPPFLP